MISDVENEFTEVEAKQHLNSIIKFTTDEGTGLEKNSIGPRWNASFSTRIIEVGLGVIFVTEAVETRVNTNNFLKNQPKKKKKKKKKKHTLEGTQLKPQKIPEILCQLDVQY
jgi:hypothetical protein